MLAVYCPEAGVSSKEGWVLAETKSHQQVSYRDDCPYSLLTRSTKGNHPHCWLGFVLVPRISYGWHRERKQNLQPFRNFGIIQRLYNCRNQVTLQEIVQNIVSCSIVYSTRQDTKHSQSSRQVQRERDYRRSGAQVYRDHQGL